MSYTAPVKDLLFNIAQLADLDGLAASVPAHADHGLDTAAAVLEECAKLSEQVIAPLNHEGDKNPSSFSAGSVSTTPGFKEAFRQYAEGGWQGLVHPEDFGGQGLPKTIAAACQELVQGANLSFALCPLLTDGAIEALLTAGSDAQKALYIPKLIDGSWTGTMNLTEPQAGSDLAAVRTRAEPQADGTYKLFGTKIFITYGEHDMADNIVHLVLARTPDAPAGVKGISLFLVPKFLVNADGQLGARNDAHCVSIEHKLGIKASPTAVLQFGDGMAQEASGTGPGAVGELIGQENRGLEYMFIMMNAARFGVGIQGLALSERAYQHAVHYARDRVQSRPVDGSTPGAATIIHHPDVRRMLMTMRALTEGCRALALYAAGCYDRAHALGDKDAQAFYEFLVPLVKGYSTEVAHEVTSLGVQVHGGMGFIEETGAAQHYRDAKILTIYEGTTAIQANDLIGRKTLRDGGQFALGLAQRVEETEAELSQHGAAAHAVRANLSHARQAYEAVVDFMAAQGKGNPNAVFAGSVPYLMLAGNLAAGWCLARGLLAAEKAIQAGEDLAFMQAKVTTARFYAEHILPRTAALRDAILNGAESCLALPLEAF
jgi:alkylation response protein AidB-like acyl-CoA dehydrogenase